MIVLARPAPDYRVLLRRAGTPMPGVERLTFYPRGRDALLAGLGLLALRPGDAIIVPAYICDSTIAPLRNAGYQIVFIDVETDLQLDPGKVAEAIGRHRAKALLVVHYFGFPAAIERLMAVCRPLGVKVIEDCCHGFLTRVRGERLGGVGDAAIFSMRKTLPVADGGALRVNDPTVPPPPDSVVGAPGIARYLLSRAVESVVAGVGWPNIYSPAIDRVKRRLRGSGRPPRDAESTPAEVFPVAVGPSSQLARYLGDANYLASVERRVAENYREVVEALSALGWMPLVPRLEEGWVPQWAPFQDRDGGVVEWMRENGFGAGRWPWHELPGAVDASAERYPVAHGLDRGLVLLPVHQGIGARHLRAIVAAASDRRRG